MAIGTTFKSYNLAREFVDIQEEPIAWDIVQVADGNKVAWLAINRGRFDISAARFEKESS